jgi:hypothetical protein
VLDAIIAILAAVPTLYLAHLGINISLKTPKKSDDVERRRLKRHIYIAATISLLFIGVQALRNSSVIERLLLKNVAEQMHRLSFLKLINRVIISGSPLDYHFP